jgi:hypothetical protein
VNEMPRFDNPLDNVRVAAPCSADWEQMMGTERARFCTRCDLNVYNLSSMTKAEAEHLIANNEGRLCVRFYRRADGSVLTKNCPVGLRAIRRRLTYVGKAVASAVLTFFAGIGIYTVAMKAEIRSSPMMGEIALQLPPPTPPPVEEPVIMGELVQGGVSFTPPEKKSVRRHR